MTSKLILPYQTMTVNTPSSFSPNIVKYPTNFPLNSLSLPSSLSSSPDMSMYEGEKDVFIAQLFQCPLFDSHLFLCQQFSHELIPPLSQHHTISLIEALASLFKKTYTIQAKDHEFNVQFNLLELLEYLKQAGEYGKTQGYHTRIQKIEIVGGAVLELLKDYILETLRTKQISPPPSYNKKSSSHFYTLLRDLDIRLHLEKAGEDDFSFFNEHLCKFLIKKGKNLPQELDERELIKFIYQQCFYSPYKTLFNHNKYSSVCLKYDISDSNKKENPDINLVVCELKRQELFILNGLRLDISLLIKYWPQFNSLSYFISALRKKQIPLPIQINTTHGWEAIIDQVGGMIRALELETINDAGWSLLLKEYIKGKRCLQQGIEDSLLEKLFLTLSAYENCQPAPHMPHVVINNIIQKSNVNPSCSLSFEEKWAILASYWLNKSIENHLSKEMASALIFQACLSLHYNGKSTYIPSLWKEMRGLIPQTISSHPLFDLINQAMMNHCTPYLFPLIVAFLEVKLFFYLNCSLNTERDPNFYAQLTFHQEKTFIQTCLGGAHLLFPFDPLQALKNLQLSKNRMNSDEEQIFHKMDQLLTFPFSFAGESVSVIGRHRRALNLHIETYKIEAQKYIEKETNVFWKKILGEWLIACQAQSPTYSGSQYVENCLAYLLSQNPYHDVHQRERLLVSLENGAVRTQDRLFSSMRTFLQQKKQKDIPPVLIWAIALARTGTELRGKLAYQIWQSYSHSLEDKDKQELQLQFIQSLVIGRPDLALNLLNEIASSLPFKQGIKILTSFQTSVISKYQHLIAPKTFVTLAKIIRKLQKPNPSTKIDQFFSLIQWTIHSLWQQEHILYIENLLSLLTPDLVEEGMEKEMEDCWLDCIQSFFKTSYRQKAVNLWLKKPKTCKQDASIKQLILHLYSLPLEQQDFLLIENYLEHYVEALTTKPTNFEIREETQKLFRQLLPSFYSNQKKFTLQERDILFKILAHPAFIDLLEQEETLPFLSEMLSYSCKIDKASTHEQMNLIPSMISFLSAILSHENAGPLTCLNTLHQSFPDFKHIPSAIEQFIKMHIKTLLPVLIENKSHFIKNQIQNKSALFIFFNLALEKFPKDKIKNFYRQFLIENRKKIVNVYSISIGGEWISIDRKLIEIFEKSESVSLQVEAYNICLSIKDFTKAKQFLIKILQAKEENTQTESNEMHHSLALKFISNLKEENQAEILYQLIIEYLQSILPLQVNSAIIENYWDIFFICVKSDSHLIDLLILQEFLINHSTNEDLNSKNKLKSYFILIEKLKSIQKEGEAKCLLVRFFQLTIEEDWLKRENYLTAMKWIETLEQPNHPILLKWLSSVGQYKDIGHLATKQLILSLHNSHSCPIEKRWDYLRKNYELIKNPEFQLILYTTLSYLIEEEMQKPLQDTQLLEYLGNLLKEETFLKDRATICLLVDKTLQILTHLSSDLQGFRLAFIAEWGGMYKQYASEEYIHSLLFNLIDKGSFKLADCEIFVYLIQKAKFKIPIKAFSTIINKNDEIRNPNAAKKLWQLFWNSFARDKNLQGNVDEIITCWDGMFGPLLEYYPQGFLDILYNPSLILTLVKSEKLSIDLRLQIIRIILSFSSDAICSLEKGHEFLPSWMVLRDHFSQWISSIKEKDIEMEEAISYAQNSILISTLLVYSVFGKDLEFETVCIDYKHSLSKIQNASVLSVQSGFLQPLWMNFPFNRKVKFIHCILPSFIKVIEHVMISYPRNHVPNKTSQFLLKVIEELSPEEGLKVIHMLKQSSSSALIAQAYKCANTLLISKKKSLLISQQERNILKKAIQDLINDTYVQHFDAVNVFLLDLINAAEDLISREERGLFILYISKRYRASLIPIHDIDKDQIEKQLTTRVSIIAICPLLFNIEQVENEIIEQQIDLAFDALLEFCLLVNREEVKLSNTSLQLNLTPNIKIANLSEVAYMQEYQQLMKSIEKRIENKRVQKKEILRLKGNYYIQFLRKLVTFETKQTHDYRTLNKEIQRVFTILLDLNSPDQQAVMTLIDQFASRPLPDELICLRDDYYEAIRYVLKVAVKNNLEKNYRTYWIKYAYLIPNYCKIVAQPQQLAECLPNLIKKLCNSNCYIHTAMASEILIYHLIQNKTLLATLPIDLSDCWQNLFESMLHINYKFSDLDKVLNSYLDWAKHYQINSPLIKFESHLAKYSCISIHLAKNKEKQNKLASMSIAVFKVLCRSIPLIQIDDVQEDHPIIISPPSASEIAKQVSKFLYQAFLDHHFDAHYTQYLELCITYSSLIESCTNDASSFDHLTNSISYLILIERKENPFSCEELSLRAHTMSQWLLRLSHLSLPKAQYIFKLAENKKIYEGFENADQILFELKSALFLTNT